MNTHPYLGDDFDKWTSQWDKAQKDGTFQDAPKPPEVTPQNEPGDFFGNHRPKSEKSIRDVDADYWRAVYGLSNHAGDTPDPLDAAEMLQEARRLDEADKKKPKRPKTEKLVPGSKLDKSNGLKKKKVNVIADDPNVQQFGTYGQDGVDGDTGMTRVSPGWAADERLENLEDLKRSLYELECKMSDSDGLSDSKAKSVQSKIKAIKKQIDDLSNDLVPRFPSDHM